MSPVFSSPLVIFDGSNILDWLLDIENFFALGRFREEDKLSIVALYVEGRVKKWFVWVLRRGGFRNWQDFTHQLVIRFTESIDEEPSPLKHSGSVLVSNPEFEELSPCEIVLNQAPKPVLKPHEARGLGVNSDPWNNEVSNGVKFDGEEERNKVIHFAKREIKVVESRMKADEKVIDSAAEVLASGDTDVNMQGAKDTSDGAGTENGVHEFAVKPMQIETDAKAATLTKQAGDLIEEQHKTLNFKQQLVVRFTESIEEDPGTRVFDSKQTGSVVVSVTELDDLSSHIAGLENCPLAKLVYTVNGSSAALARMDNAKQRMTLPDAARLPQLSSPVKHVFHTGKVTKIATVSKQLEVLEDRVDVGIVEELLGLHLLAYIVKVICFDPGSDSAVTWFIEMGFSDVNHEVSKHTRLFFFSGNKQVSEIGIVGGNSEAFALIIGRSSLVSALGYDLNDIFLALAIGYASVICYGSSPKQKALVTKLIKTKRDPTTLAIGNGANDGKRLQEADIEVWISGVESRQAVMSSDIAFARFTYLERLLLVHSNWCYRRISKLICYFFYKNITFGFTLFLFGTYTSFFPTLAYNDWLASGHNVTNGLELWMCCKDKFSDVDSWLSSTDFTKHFHLNKLEGKLGFVGGSIDRFEQAYYCKRKKKVFQGKKVAENAKEKETFEGYHKKKKEGNLVTEEDEMGEPLV